jgi:hypothetical protein
MSYLREKLSSMDINYYLVFFAAETPQSDFFKYSDSLKAGAPSFLWNAEQGPPPESVVKMVNPSHLLLDVDGTVIRVWPGSYKDKPVRERMARQIVADTLVATDAEGTTSVMKSPVGHGAVSARSGRAAAFTSPGAIGSKNMSKP